MKSKITAFFLAGLVLVVFSGIFLPSQSQALTLVSSRTDLAGNDFIDWGGLGNPYETPPSGSTILSNMGLTATVDLISGTHFELFTQPDGWTGNFANGDNLLFTNYSAGPIDITFSSPVYAAGAQIQRNYMGGFSGGIEAFDINHISLGIFTLAGLSTDLEDNTAIFLGVYDSGGKIISIEFTVDNNTAGYGFAINRLDLRTTAVPLPPSMLLLGSGLGLLGFWRRKSS